MMKINSILLFLIATSSMVRAEIINLNANGADGSDGSAGHSYSTSPGSSFGRGSDGGDAGHSTAGKDAGNIDVNLKQMTSSTGAATLVVTGTVRGSGTNASINLNQAALVTAEAKGGKGGDGGIGGDGQGGCNGANGHDASRYSSGTNGSPGCSGGNGGDGTRGSNGGDGGLVKAKVKIDETHLFLAFSCDSSAGRGGAPGQNGRAGQGGHGGRGGSSYSWSERVYDGESCTTTTRSNGNGSYSSSRSCSPRYRTVYHSNPGGFSGSNGSSGSSGNGDTSGGRAGTNGSCVYLVENENGSVDSFKNKFTLSIASFKLREANGDGIIEPGETVYVENMVVKNGEGVPSPAGKAKLSLFLYNSRYIMAEPVMIELPQIGPNSTYKVPGNLPLKISDTKPVGSEERWADTDTVKIDNTVTVVDRAVPEFNNQRSIQITYPIELTRFDFPASAAAGETRPVVWAIKNISGKDFGGESELERKVQFHFDTIGGLAKDVPFQLTDDQGRSVHVPQTYIREILNLKAGQEIRIEGSLFIPTEVLPYTDLAVETSLGLGMEKHLSPRDIQKKKRSLRIAQTFNPNTEADLVLVTNTQTEREEFVAWQEVFKKLKLRFAVWDLSYYGYLSLIKDFEGTNSNFMRYLKNKTMVILNDPATREDSIAEKLSRNEFLDAASNSNARFLVLGGKAEELKKLVTDLIIPTRKDGSHEHIINEALEKKDVPEAIGRALTLNMVKTYYFWSSPDRDDLKDQINKWNSYLQTMSPSDKFAFSFYFSPTKSKENWYSKTFSVGEIQIGRTLTPGGGLVLTLPLSSEELHNPDQVKSEEMFRAILLALDPVFLMELSRYFDLQNSKLGYWIQDALIYQAVSEVDREEVFFDVSGTPPEDNRWRFFKALTQHAKNKRDEQSVLLTSNIAAALEFYNSKIPNLGNFKLGRKLHEFLGEWEDLARGVNPSKYDENRTAFLNKLNGNFTKRKALLVDLEARDNARHQLTWPAIYRLNTSEMMLERNLIQEGK